VPFAISNNENMKILLENMDYKERPCYVYIDGIAVENVQKVEISSDSSSSKIAFSQEKYLSLLQNSKAN
jgi:hypothetical protein